MRVRNGTLPVVVLISLGVFGLPSRSPYRPDPGWSGYPPPPYAYSYQGYPPPSVPNGDPHMTQIWHMGSYCVTPSGAHKLGWPVQVGSRCADVNPQTGEFETGEVRGWGTSQGQQYAGG